MSILIKGMDMPKASNEDCIAVIRSNGKVEVWQTGMKEFEAQAIQIPTPHGRIIDADELKEKRETMCWKDEYYMTHESDFIDSRHIDNAPTILEAER